MGASSSAKGELLPLDAKEVIHKAAESFAAARKRAGGRIDTGMGVGWAEVLLSTSIEDSSKEHGHL